MTVKISIILWKERLTTGKKNGNEFNKENVCNLILTSSTFAPDYYALEKFVTMKCLSKIGEEMKILRL